MVYPNIERAAILIALDNGAINRSCSEEELLSKLPGILAGSSEDALLDIDNWLAKLSEEDFDDVCAGEEDMRKELLEDAPFFTDQLLDHIFFSI